MTWQRVSSSYDLVAGKYETRFLDELQRKPRDRELLEVFAGSVGDPVVDVGCGPGQIGDFVSRHGHRVVGIDFSPEMSRLAYGRLGAAVTADMRALPLANCSVGGVLAFYSLIHVRRTELEVVLREFHRVLRPSGRVLFSAHEGHGEVELDEFLDEPVPMVATFFELDELVAASRAVGLQVRVAERRTSYPSESKTCRLYVEALRPHSVPE